MGTDTIFKAYKKEHIVKLIGVRVLVDITNINSGKLMMHEDRVQQISPSSSLVWNGSTPKHHNYV